MTMNYIVLQGDEQTAAVTGFVNMEYHFLQFVLYRRDGSSLQFFLRSLTLPARPRINDFRWALLRTEAARPPYSAHLKRFCHFAYSVLRLSCDNEPAYIRPLQDDATLRNLLRLHSRGEHQIVFYLEQSYEKTWKPKNIFSYPRQQVYSSQGRYNTELTRVRNLPSEETYFGSNKSTFASSERDSVYTNNSGHNVSVASEAYFSDQNVELDSMSDLSCDKNYPKSDRTAAPWVMHYCRQLALPAYLGTPHVMNGSSLLGPSTEFIAATQPSFYYSDVPYHYYFYPPSSEPGFQPIAPHVYQ